jgi:hypothetical protein
LWLVKDSKQHLAFAEPHGLQHEGPGHKKIDFHRVIKDMHVLFMEDQRDTYIASIIQRMAA